MTWQRIDEDTYIDDTLVTCAEYQLFIDEMRKQGKYYQPDHWTSNQFPDGHARESIVGVRQTDAEGFCEWLTNREHGKWKFRLPNQDDSDSATSLECNKKAIGYWLDNKDSLVWVNTPIDARNVDVDKIQSAVLTHFLSRLNHYSVIHTSEIASVVLAECVACKNEPVSLFERATYRHIGNLRDLLSDIRMRSPTRDFVRAQNILLDLSVNRYVALEPLSFRSSVLEHELVDDSFRLFIDLFTIQERIAGRSPAFEGIRLVKERIK